MASSSSAAGWCWLYWLPLMVKEGRGGLGVEEGGSALLVYGLLAVVGVVGSLLCWVVPGGPAWGSWNWSQRRKVSLKGPRGLPVLGSLWEMGGLAHRRLAELGRKHGATELMALSLGSTRVIIASQPGSARELLNSSAFADRPLKQSAQELLFGRAIGFAPQGEYWRRLRRIAANHLFSPKRIQAHEPARQAEVQRMLAAVEDGASLALRPLLQQASLNNIMASVFGVHDNLSAASPTGLHLQAMVREGFQLLGAFNWSDHLPALQSLDPSGILHRCKALVPQVKLFVHDIIQQHRASRSSVPKDPALGDFVDALLDLEGEEQLSDDDMVAVLWEMIFRGTDTTAILTEWVMAEIVLKPGVQRRIHEELDAVVGKEREVRDADVGKLLYLQAVIKESLRLHPPGPLLSWARLSSQDVTLAGHHVPAGTTAMVNMWAITHDAAIWADPFEFKPERFLAAEGGQEVDIRGNDLRLAPFGAGRRVCPGRALGLATVHLWVARLLQQFHWSPSPQHPVDLQEVLKLSCEMVHPLVACPRHRLPTMLGH